MAISKFQVGDLVYGYTSHGKHYQGNIGIAMKLFEGRIGDEAHVTIQLPTGVEEIRDVDKTACAGKPVKRSGSIICKWLLSGTFSRLPDGVSEHQEWVCEMVTNEGWALALDPWGQPHWLPPGEPYVVRRLNERFEIVMQTTLPSAR